MDIADLQTWIGRSEVVEERVAPFPANALAATLDRVGPAFDDTSVLPPLWHWLHFLKPGLLSRAGPDGHPTRGGFIPPVPLPRRMWASGDLEFTAPIEIGTVLRRVSTIEDVIRKSGRSGELVFVTVRHQILNGDSICVNERQDIVYREPPVPGATAPEPLAAPERSAFSRTIQPDPVLLQRYSALTFNSHRIHFDRDYCLHNEGYPGLVVHGPLLATLLLDLLRQQYPDANITTFSFRAAAPIFDLHAFSLHGEPDETGPSFRLWARRHDGSLAMRATATLA
ncbi:MaoC family dehydratase N-terminal domain-containing protein [Leisingera daeponensis]|nr:MaoC family dehydratase N-terminal domain-containing protein [Leisingera daeponensis]